MVELVVTLLRVFRLVVTLTPRVAALRDARPAVNYPWRPLRAPRAVSSVRITIFWAHQVDYDWSDYLATRSDELGNAPEADW